MPPSPGVLTGLFHSHIGPHETAQQYYQRIFILSLRFPALTTLGVPHPDVLTIEEAVRHILLRCSLPQALDFLHTQLLAGICVANPVRDSPTTHSLPLSLFFALSPLMMKHSKADNLGSLFSLRSFLASASRFSLAIVNKLALAQGETLSKKNCSNDYHTKTSASLASLTRFSLMNYES